MAENVHAEGDDVRHTVRASNFDILVYNSWKAEVIRERRFRREFLFVPYDSWEREEVPLDVQVTFSGVDGQTAGPFPPDQSSVGYRAIERWNLFFGFVQPNPPMQPDAIVGMQVNYVFDRQPITLPEGVNRISQVVAGIVIAVAIVVVAIITWPFLVGLAAFLGL